MSALTTVFIAPSFRRPEGPLPSRIGAQPIVNQLSLTLPKPVLGLRSRNLAHFSCALIASSQLSSANLSMVSPARESGLNMEVAVKGISEEKVVSTCHPVTQDDGKVRLGTLSPSF